MEQKLKLYPHQEEGLRRVLKEPFYPLFMEQGTGKTPVAIKAIEHRFLNENIYRVILFVPNSIVYNWELEIAKFLNIPQEQYVVETLDHKQKRKRLERLRDFLAHDPNNLTLNQLRKKGYKGKKKDIIKNHKQKLMILVLNFEKARVMFRELKKYKPQYLVVDESHKLRNENSTSKGVYKLTRTCKYRNLLTGTPICNGYEDLFMQYKILNEEILGSAYKDFESRFVVKGGYMNYAIVGYRNTRKLKRIIRKTSYRVKIEECVDLPPLIPKNLFCELSPPSAKAYKEMNQEMLTQVDRISQEITRAELKQVCRENGIVYSPKESYSSLLLKASEFINQASCEIVLTQMMRLQQITGGFLTLDTKEVMALGTEKLDLAKEVVGDSTNPVLIFCQYVPEIEMLEKELGKLKKRVKVYRDPKQRKQIYSDFHKGLVDVLILQLRSGSVGLNLQLANKLIFYSWNFSSDDYVQAIARMKRNGQKRPMEVIHLIAKGTVDEHILDTIKHKRKLADDLLD